MNHSIGAGKERALRAAMALFGVSETDLDERFIFAGGKGGQKINKTAVCVYLKHRPTGIEVKCRAGRSQAMNRFFARRILVARIASLAEGVATAERRRIEKIRRQKRRRSRRAKEKMLAGKRMQSERKRLRRRPEAE